ncbi:diguanylate cyclase [Actinoplanes sp. TRM 88003]|uniref:Diguanylate cyclase n=1 Tax=Paractinoplanes aksuensis TaxID=2939490 RepID=A0ABT1DHY0_9ACTN|nr:diguanylate cyclase [Actinoplanes aksuensis]MCO8270420.1 diguanylate cyclase [Actinoplanes aksuensis]
MNIRSRRFRRAATRALATGHHTAVVVIDVVQPVPAQFPRILRGCVPPSGRVGRLADDEFAVLLSHLAFPDQAYDVAGNIAAALSPIIVNGRLVPLAAAIGVAVSAPGELTAGELVDRARQAMRRAQQVGPQTRWAVWQEVSPPSAA